jgi:CIC family chloride channel protein
MAILKVRDAMQPVPAGLPSDLPLEQAIARFANHGPDALPVVDPAGRYEGTVTMRAVEQALQGNENPPAAELARTVAALKEEESLEEALETLLGSDGSGAPVLAPDGQTLVGWLTHRDVLRLYQERVARPGHFGGGLDA